MRRALICVGLLASLALAACEKEEVAAPVVKKSLARQDQMFAGEEQIQSVATGSVTREPGGLELKATGLVASPGYTRAGFLPRIYPARPADGIYEIDVVAMKPATPTAPTPTAVSANAAWHKYSDDRVKGVKFITQTNTLVAMLPPAPATKAP